VVHGGVLAAPNAAVAMVLVVGIAGFEVVRVVERRADEVPLQRGAVTLVHRKSLVGAPAHRAVVDDEAVAAGAAKGIVAPGSVLEALVLVFVAHPKPDKAHNHVVSLDLHRVIGQANATARGSLAGDGGIGLADSERREQVDGARNPENDGARGGLGGKRVAQ
jgi:hypothetical protein